MSVECTEGCLVGLFEENSLPQLHVSRIRVVPKSMPGQWRLIIDLSSPEGCIVDDGVRESLCLLSYVYVDTAVIMAVRNGCGILVTKVYIQNVYCTILVHP